MAARSISGQLCLVFGLLDPPPPTAVSLQEFSAGRALHVFFSLRERMTRNARDVFQWFLCTTCILPRCFAALINEINETRVGCVRSPDRHSWILMGDFNLAPSGSAKIFW